MAYLTLVGFFVLCALLVDASQLSRREAADALVTHSAALNAVEASHAEPKKAEEKAKKDAGSKKDSKVEDLNKKMPLKAQEQGFTGKKVEHKNGTTGTSDWQKEYGHSSSFTQAVRVRGEPKKAEAKATKDAKDSKKDSKEEDLNKKMPLKAQEQGFTGKKVEHDDGKTGTSDWQKEYGHSPSFTQATHLRGEPKKAEAKAKKDGKDAKKDSKVEDLNKKMPLKAQEQGFTGKKVEHDDGKTGTSDWQKEYGHSASFTQALHLRGEPKKAEKAKADAKGSKKDSKVEDLNKKMPLKAQEQGFTGKKVEHNDGKTGTSDWQKEYGHSSSFTQAMHLRGEPKKAEAKAKKDGKDSKKDSKVEDLGKKMPLKAAEQGFTGKKVKHDDGKTGTSDWQSEYGNSPSFTQALRLGGEPKKKAAEDKKGDKKKDSKVEDLNKKMPLKAQEQGFTGKKVQHDDGKTGTSDWQKEYGSKSALMQGEPKKKEAGEAKKDAGKSKKVDLMKDMPLKAQEQGYSGEHVKHVDGKTKTDDWRDEYGHEVATSPAPPAPKKSGCIQPRSFSAAVLSLMALSLLMQ